MIEKRKILNKKCKNLKFKKIANKQKLQERGITLIALVVTIVILLILAGVTLNIALSDGGLFEKAKEGAEKYKKAQTNEEGIITDIEKAIDKYGSGNPTPSTPTPSEGTPTPMSIADAKSKAEKFEETTTVTDGNGNKVVIPGEFKIAADSGDTVQEGIVVEDTKGNQFVWIPVSNVDGDNKMTGSENEEDLIKVDNNKTVEITLGRYTFDKEDGTPKMEQNGTNQEADIPIEEYYYESIKTVRLDGGAGAKNLAKFIQSVEDKHGYYIARYEAGDGSEEISKAGAVRNSLTQKTASSAARGVYETKDKEAKYVESDLVNSYAWDTAIVYIQSMKEENKNYANAKSTISILKDTGMTGDEMCHIFDMAGNVCELTTEFSGRESKSCVTRGGLAGSVGGTAYRGAMSFMTKSSGCGFRILLYMK